MSIAAIARINGSKSQGPITPEGKAKSAQNSLKHGLTSSRVVLPGESQEAFDQLEASLLDTLKPATDFEKELVREMTSARWRLRRIEEMETALVQREMRRLAEEQGEEADLDEIRMQAYVEVAESRAFRNLTRHQGQLRRAYEKAWKELQALQLHRVQSEQSAVLRLVGNDAALGAYLNAPMPGSFCYEDKFETASITEPHPVRHEPRP